MQVHAVMYYFVKYDNIIVTVITLVSCKILSVVC